MEKSTLKPQIFNKAKAKKILPALSTEDNKSSRGRSLILAGSPDFPGAGILAARGALRAGSGYVTLAQRNTAISSLENPDFLLQDLNKISLFDLKFDAVLVGPGFGVNEFTAKVIRDLKKNSVTRVILDADALTVCAHEKLFPLPQSWIVTPHTGELGRCLGISAEEIQKNRVKALRLAVDLFQCVVLLKGAGTLIGDAQSTYQITSGNEALAKAGTGDVLAGVITAFRAQGLEARSAALLGAYAHGATANLWVQSKKDALSMTASDVVESLPRILWRLRQSD